jgi:hypothetical protein
MEPSDFTLNVVVKYTLESDTRTEIRKTLSIDIPIIQPFHTIFDILPRLGRESDMPDPFSEETLPLSVSQRWLLTTSITRLGSEKLDLQHIGVTGTFNQEEMSIELYEGDGCSPGNDQVFGISLGSTLITELHNVPHNAETKFVLTRPEGSEITDVRLDLSVKWRRKTPSSENEWNIITIPIPELTFFPFAPRILAGYHVYFFLT